jgi:hypothetical protein
MRAHTITTHAIKLAFSFAALRKFRDLSSKVWTDEMIEGQVKTTAKAIERHRSQFVRDMDAYEDRYDDAVEEIAERMITEMLAAITDPPSVNYNTTMKIIRAAFQRGDQT